MTAGTDSGRSPRGSVADAVWMRHAARLAWRGHGGAEPNPLVGCVIVGRDGSVLGSGWHARVGGPHAERQALADARRRGNDVRGATVFVTLEPCHGVGRTGPCTEAIVASGVARVVAARLDPHPKGAGGLRDLEQHGLAVALVPEPSAVRVGEPFARRVLTGLPWIVAKWAQTIDGRLATRSGESRWISSSASRAMVHRERGRVDAILTGIGSVLADDSLLTARGVRVRRIARRVVVDPDLRLPDDGRLMRSLDVAPLTVACRLAHADGQRAVALRQRGIEVIGLSAARRPWMEPDPQADPATARLDLGALMRELVTRHGAATVLSEGGPALIASMFSQRLIDEAWVFTAGVILGDGQARSLVDGRIAPRLCDGITMELIDTRRRGNDVVARWRVC